MYDKDSVLAAIEEQKVQFISLWFADITGLVKTITIPAKKLEDVIEYGMNFDGSSIESFARIAESDMVLKPDLNTFTTLPWDAEDERSARIICNVHTPQGDPFIGDPRNVLLRVLQQAEELGYSYKTGMELEFYLFQQENGDTLTPLKPHDSASYFDMSTRYFPGVRRRMLATLEGLGMTVDSAHHEIGSGQHEIGFAYNDALVSADNLMTARVALKTVAYKIGLLCTFMPRPSSELPGSGMHTHQSLHDRHTDDNVFADPDKDYGLTDVARHFLAGQLYHARGMSAILSPLVNSYKRLGVSFEAPTYITWAHINRAGSAVIRVPHIAPGRESHTRIEIRNPDPSANPYLATAVLLAAGLDGIRQRMELPAASEETLLRRQRQMRTIETLPESLGEALDELSQNDVLLAALGEFIGDRYVAARQQELDEYNQQVTPWEVSRYITRY
jgi:glutamine synthetase